MQPRLRRALGSSDLRTRHRAHCVVGDPSAHHRRNSGADTRVALESQGTLTTPPLSSRARAGRMASRLGRGLTHSAYIGLTANGQQMLGEIRMIAVGIEDILARV